MWNIWRNELNGYNTQSDQHHPIAIGGSYWVMLVGLGAYMYKGMLVSDPQAACPLRVGPISYSIGGM